MSESILSAVLEGIRDEFILETGLELGLLAPVGVAAAGAAEASGAAGEASSLFMPAPKPTAGAGFVAWLAKGGWAVIAAGAVAAVGIAVGAFFLGSRGETPPAGSEQPTGEVSQSLPVGGLTEEPSETQDQTEPETEAMTHPCESGHTLSAWTDGRAPVCYRAGTRWAVCSVCGETVTEETTRLPHNPAEGYCSVCGLVEGAEEGFVYGFETRKDGTVYAVLSARDGAEGERLVLPNVAYHPDSDAMVPVAAIGNNLFRDDTVLRTVVIPDTMTVIGDYAFLRCASLASAELPDGVEDIGHGAFGGCTSLTEVTVPDTVRWVRSGAFQECTSLERITLPRLDNNIKFKGIFNYDKQAGIQLPETLKTVVLTGSDSIPAGAFSECIYLTEIILPETVAEIGEAAFRACSSLETLNLPDSLTEISPRLFEECRALREIILPEGITAIGSKAFYYCESLTALYVPDSVASVGAYALDECRALKWISLPTLDRMNLASQFIHGGRCYLKTAIFRGGTTLSEASLSQMVYLRKIYLPATLTHIEKDALKQNGATDIYFAGTAEEWEAVRVDPEGNELRLSNITVHFEQPPAESPEDILP